ncbi:MAG: efflux transporter outer membrane subunit [Desulfobacterales bacterium]|uniref:Efflux transporter outer membrane subunit n=1 Tax=Candidatus Desulfatibia vada TaxID=2841696 RepID=A0A8J6NYU8_9BACT|nr:efflux transporter outer membrane subunit [Candidatus Desulfatibia vada]MBL6971817.1 efflux transporter outer membrane subunit [Desulfobacterales bacterium]
MKKLVKIVALVIIVPLTGCMMGPNFQKPDVETPYNFRFAESEPEAAANLKWWELFNDPVLNSLIITALTDNKDAMIAASRIEEARASLGFTRADQYPRLDIEGGARVGTFTGVSRSSTTDKSAYIAPVLSWEIDFWGKYRRSTEFARAQLMASEYSLRTVQIGLISEVAGTYYLLLDYRLRLFISKSTLDSRQKSLDIIQKRFDKGIIPELDLNQAQIQKEIAVAAIPLYERLIANTENALSILLGKFPGEIETGYDLNDQTFLPDIPAGLPSSILERRPDVAEAMYLLEAQTAKIGVAEALRFPSITLTGLFGAASSELSSVTTDGGVWSVGGSLFGPLFNFNKNIERVEIEKERTRQTLYFYENRVLNAFREVADALNEIQTYKRQISSVERKYTAAKNAAFLSKLRYDKGVTSYLEVLETERTLFSVGLELSELKQQFYNAYVKLYKALGGGWLSKEEMEQVQNQPEAPKK